MIFLRCRRISVCNPPIPLRPPSHHNSHSHILGPITPPASSAEPLCFLSLEGRKYETNIRTDTMRWTGTYGQAQCGRREHTDRHNAVDGNNRTDKVRWTGLYGQTRCGGRGHTDRHGAVDRNIRTDKVRWTGTYRQTRCGGQEHTDTHGAVDGNIRTGTVRWTGNVSCYGNNSIPDLFLRPTAPSS